MATSHASTMREVFDGTTPRPELSLVALIADNGTVPARTPAVLPAGRTPTRVLGRALLTRPQRAAS